MNSLFENMEISGRKLNNRFVFAPVKTAFGTPDGTVTRRQIDFYTQIAENGPAIVISEPMAVLPSGREHPKQLRIDLDNSSDELKKIVNAVHSKNALAAAHLNHAGAAANPKACGGKTFAPSPLTCPTTGAAAEVLNENQINEIFRAFEKSAEKALKAGFDFIEVQGGLGYLISQFSSGAINSRNDKYGENRLLFAEEVFKAVKKGAPELPLILRISADEMAPGKGVSKEEIESLVKLAEETGFSILHASMGNACFSPPWYYHHGSLPEEPQLKALKWIKSITKLPVIAAGRMGREEKINKVISEGSADLIALGRPLLADPDFIEKLKKENSAQPLMYCGYCLQGCLHKVKNGLPIGCNYNPRIGIKGVDKSRNPQKVLIAGGGPAGLSAGIFLSEKGHTVTLAEKSSVLGGQFEMAVKVPGKEAMKDPLKAMEDTAASEISRIITNTEVNADFIRKEKPHMLVWAAGAVQNIPEIKGLESQNTITSLDYFRKPETVSGKRILVIGAGRIGLEITEKLAKEGFEVTATKRSDPVGAEMEMVTRKLILMRLDKMENVKISPHTTVKEFSEDSVIVEIDGKTEKWGKFDTVILASGLLPGEKPSEEIYSMVKNVVLLGDCDHVSDIYEAVHSAYELAEQTG